MTAVKLDSKTHQSDALQERDKALLFEHGIACTEWTETTHECRPKGRSGGGAIIAI